MAYRRHLTSTAAWPSTSPRSWTGTHQACRRPTPRACAPPPSPTLEQVSDAIVHPAQRDFMPGRGMLTNVFEALPLVQLSRFMVDAVPAVVLLDIRAAVPSVSWEWIWLVLRRLVVPE